MKAKTNIHSAHDTEVNKIILIIVDLRPVYQQLCSLALLDLAWWRWTRQSLHNWAQRVDIRNKLKNFPLLFEMDWIIIPDICSV